jgi:phage gpG-like protein
MAFTLTFDVAGDTQLQRSFSRFTENVKDYSPAFRAIAGDFHKGERQQFDSEGGFGSGGWRPLAPSTVEYKLAHGYPPDILVRTGRLRDSLAKITGDTIEDVQPLQLRLGSRVPYGIYHQKGTGRYPARPPIQLSEQQKVDWTKLIHRYLVKTAREVGLGD